MEKVKMVGEQARIRARRLHNFSSRFKYDEATETLEIETRGDHDKDLAEVLDYVDNGQGPYQEKVEG